MAKAPKTPKTTAPAPLATPNDLSDDAVRDLSGAINALLADTFALYMKTKNFHWHMSGPHFRDQVVQISRLDERVGPEPRV